MDPFLELDRVRLAVVGDLRQRLGGERYEFRRPREVVVRVERLEEHLNERPGVQVVNARRVETGLGRGENMADDFFHVGGVNGRRGERSDGSRDERHADGARET